IVDGWERLASGKSQRRAATLDFLRTGRREVWAWAAGLAACSMFLAYGLTLSVVPRDEPGPRPERVLADASNSAGPLSSALPVTKVVSPLAAANSAALHTSARPRLGVRSAEAAARQDCREHTASTR
ncbi:MAG TPA: hypothetical protein VFN67_31890, partial [Polyangiales bacterium]|nr:hypothetical protein [Polyangiales bacterium]